MRAVVHELDAKSRVLQGWLRPASQLAQLSAADLDAVAGMIFALRRHRNQVVRDDGGAKFIAAMHALLYGDDADLGTRLEQFLKELNVVNVSRGVEIAGELLHFTFPERYWLWSRWMYDPEVHTGVLPLLMDGDQELRGSSLGETYLRVGRAIVVVTEVEDAKWLFHRGLTDSPALRPFAIDAFLAASYCAYLYGVTAWRLTREFHKVLPPMPRLVRRMFGLQLAAQG